MRKGSAAEPGDLGSTRRIVLLGQSWRSLMERQESCSLDWVVDCLVQDSVAYVVSSASCSCLFEHDQMCVSELLRLVREGAIVSEQSELCENFSSSFNIVWSATSPGPARASNQDVPGKITFEIPVVVVCTNALVRSALRLVDCAETGASLASTPGEETARRTKAERLCARVRRPPDMTSCTGQAFIGGHA